MYKFVVAICVSSSEDTSSRLSGLSFFLFIAFLHCFFSIRLIRRLIFLVHEEEKSRFVFVMLNLKVYTCSTNIFTTSVTYFLFHIFRCRIHDSGCFLGYYYFIGDVLFTLYLFLQFLGYVRYTPSNQNDDESNEVLKYKRS